MRGTITINLPEPIRQQLDKLAKDECLNRNEVIKEALRQYFALKEFHKLRSLMVPEAECRGLFTDEDIFRLVS